MCVPGWLPLISHSPPAARQSRQPTPRGGAGQRGRGSPQRGEGQRRRPRRPSRRCRLTEIHANTRRAQRPPAGGARSLSFSFSSPFLSFPPPPPVRASAAAGRVPRPAAARCPAAPAAPAPSSQRSSPPPWRRAPRPIPPAHRPSCRGARCAIGGAAALPEGRGPGGGGRPRSPVRPAVPVISSASPRPELFASRPHAYSMAGGRRAGPEPCRGHAGRGCGQPRPRPGPGLLSCSLTKAGADNAARPEVVLPCRAVCP